MRLLQPYELRAVLDTMKSDMPHESPLTRQWILLRSLSARRYGATVKELAEELEVGLKTIRRDLTALQAAGLPVEETVLSRGLKRWRIDPERWQPSLGFAFDEAVALYIARRLLEPLAGTPFWSAAQSALKKTRATLSAAALEYIDRFGETFHRARSTSSASPRTTSRSAIGSSTGWRRLR